jgi:hypothetical protein
MQKPKEGEAMSSGNGDEFQDRKLNNCVICGTNKMLGMRTQGNGKVYFLCKGHALLNDLLQAELRKADEKKRRIISTKYH